MSTMEKSCPDVLTLSGWLEGSLSPQDHSRMASHLAACDECRRTVALSSTLEAPASAGPVNEILLSKVVSASRRRRFVPFVGAAAAVLAVAVGFALYPKAAPPPVYRVANEPSAATETVAVAPAPSPLPAVKPVDSPSTLPLLPVVPPKDPVAVAPPKDPVKPPVPETPAVKPSPNPTVVDPAPLPLPAPVVAARENPRETPPADVALLTPVYVLDAVGDLWLKRDKAESKAGSLEKAAWKDWFAARSSGAAFSLEARTSVMLEKGSEAAFSHLKAEDTYGLALDQGLVLLDTEGSSQKWQISFGKNKLSFSDLNGRLAVESRGDRLSALLLDGSAEMKIGSLAKKAQVGQEIVLSREGQQVVEQKVETQRKL
ncbi:MAG: zf-HC2 domain-containing protein, partial [Planctomycetes bacterium]|nr:zf-HC2 domain-containing protein [Planctomycetota bacterium]